ncbi:lactonase family protein, partial [Streptomyces spongiae]
HIPIAPGGHHVHVPDKGTDRIHHFTYDSSSGHLLLSSPAATTVRAGAGPRHIAYHPRLALAYVVDELSSQVTVHRIDPRNGSLVPHSWVPTLPSDFTGDSTAAEIQLSSDGRLLFASNRGHDSIVTYRVDGDGTPHSPRWSPTTGQQPRFFALDPTGSVLYAANQASHTICAFRVTRAGHLEQTGRVIRTGSPVCVVFSHLI